MTQAIIAHLTDSDRCKAAGLTAIASAPILLLCRKLIAAGHDPGARLEVYRGRTLALTVRSIGEGAQLELSSSPPRFHNKRPAAMWGASPSSFQPDLGQDTPAVVLTAARTAPATAEITD